MQAVRAFKDMLNELADTRMTWEKALKVIANDARYTALKSLGERKHVFHEWVTKKKKKQEEERRLEKKKAKEGFFDLLEVQTAMHYGNIFRADCYFRRSPRTGS